MKIVAFHPRKLVIFVQILTRHQEPGVMVATLLVKGGAVSWKMG